MQPTKYQIEAHDAINRLEEANQVISDLKAEIKLLEDEIRAYQATARPNPRGDI